MGRRMTLKGQISLCLAAFFLALAGQIFLSFYQSGTVLRELDDQMGNFNAISRFQNGVERSLSAMEDYRWEYGDAKALTEELHSAFSVTNAWLWRIESDLGTVSEEQYLLYNAVSTTYDSYTALVTSWKKRWPPVRIRKPPSSTIIKSYPAAAICASIPSSC